MANYQPPSDPRNENRSTNQAERASSPWGWLLLGFLVTAVSIFGALWFVSEMLTREPLTVSEASQPTIIRITAPATAEPTITVENPTPTPIPTFTPSPTPDLKIAPSELTVGFFAQISGTDGVGLNVRDGSSTANELLFVAPEGANVLVLDGPIDNNSFRWWQLQFDDGTVGWAVDLFMIPVAEPADWPRP